MSFHISPEVIFGRIPHRKHILCSHLGQNHSEPQRTVATWKAPPIIDSHDFWWFSDILGTSPKQKLWATAHEWRNPAFKTNRWVPPAESGCTTATLSCSWVVFSSVSFYLEKAPWKPWPSMEKTCGQTTRSLFWPHPKKVRSTFEILKLSFFVFAA